MSLQRLFRSAKSHPDGAARGRPVRLLLESLDERIVPSLVLSSTSPVGTGAQAVVGADFNNDGRLDLATANLDDNSVSMLLGNGDGTFGNALHIPAGDFTAQFFGDRQLSIAVGDFNGDGHPDLATLFLETGADDWSSWGAGRVDVLFGHGDGTFQPPLNVFAPANGDYPVAVQVGDVNGDGRSDLGIYNTWGYATWSPYYTGGIDYQVVLLGNSDNSFTTIYDDNQFPTPGDSFSVRNGDLNVDGYGDRVRGIGNSVTVQLGRSDGTLGSELSHPVGQSISAVAVGDFNGDGRPDVAATSNYGNLSVLLNDGNWPRADAPTIRIGNADPVSIVEGQSGTRTATFTVALSAAYDEAVTVDYRTENGTATAGSDYEAQNGTLVIAPGETSKAISITIYGDKEAEGDEYFYVLLSNPSDGVQITQPTGFGGVTDDDGGMPPPPPPPPPPAPVPSLTISDVSHKEGRNGSMKFVFTVTLSAPSTTEVKINYATASGTAADGEDYVGASGTLTFASGETSKTITIKVKGDRKKEADETFAVNLSGAINASILDGTGIGTILNDD